MHSFNLKDIPLCRTELVKELQCSQSQKEVASRGASCQTPLDDVNWGITFSNDADLNLKDKGGKGCLFAPELIFQIKSRLFSCSVTLITVIRVQYEKKAPSLLVTWALQAFHICMQITTMASFFSARTEPSPGQMMRAGTTNNCWKR